MKVLVIEDEQRLAEYLRQGLTEAGYSVEVAHNGIDGLHLATTGPYDLLLLDRMLPGIDGIALLKAFRASVLSQEFAGKNARRWRECRRLSWSKQRAWRLRSGCPGIA